MRIVITLGDAVELAFVALVVAGLAIGVAVQWAHDVLAEHQKWRRGIGQYEWYDTEYFGNGKEASR